MQQATGATFVVENKGGAGGNIGMGSVARSTRTATRSCSRPAPIRSIRGSTRSCPTIRSMISPPSASSPSRRTCSRSRRTLAANTMKEFVALAKKNPDKFNVSTPPIGTTPQLAGRGAQAARRPAEDGDGGVRRRRRRAQGGDRRHRAALLRHARARPSADQSRHAQGARGHRHVALARFAGHPDHGGGGLQGLRVRHLYRADGAGENAAGNREQARSGCARHPAQARHAAEADRVRASR